MFSLGNCRPEERGDFMPVRILIADDHEVVRQGIRTILEARPQWDVCGEAVNGLEAVKMAKDMQPDIIIMDITMPVMSGLEATREVSKLNLNSRVLIFTMHESKSLTDSVKKTGASGFVLKSRAARDLIERSNGCWEAARFSRWMARPLRIRKLL